ncbi:M48 family metallopeptidase [Longimicrobium sp.]|uniref:M48 family metallopeptidase n=1 Tax=Longimicrobium sp. TaxID=2029185 RepID=UPI002CD8D47C|nr:M48 family metallopeptidase [Longimicrobium sp.]HSU14187.1 M48 family metallopeptidase [Longimicrobium sp.]
MSPAAGGTQRTRARARVRLAALALVVAPALAGCVNEAREKQLGAQIAANLNARVPLVQDVPLNLYVNDLGQLIARHSERPDLQYHFYIVDTDAVNAFALPGGYIYVDRGLIERTRSVSELSGVLAHEIAHVALRHGAKNLQRQMRTSSMSTVLYRTILGRDPLLDQQALQLGNQLWSAGHSRADETAADSEAVKYLIASGVDPHGMLALFRELMVEERQEPHAENVAWFSTHPNTARRITSTEQTINRLMPRPSPRLARNNASYPLFLARISMLPPPPPLIPGQQAN